MMAYHGSIFTISTLLFVLLAIVSASDYGYGSTPNIEKSKPKIELDNKTYPTKFKSETVYKSNLTKSQYEAPKSNKNYEYDPTPKIEKLKSETVYTMNHTKADNEAPKSKIDYGYSPTPKFEKLKSEEIYLEDYEDPESEEIYLEDYEGPEYQTDYPLTPKVEKSKPKTDYKLRPTKLNNEIPKPKESNKAQQPTTIGVQGVIFCKSGSNYYPIQGNFFIDLI
jgi:hypothetical protein